jgi:hypothetical protein
LAPHRIPYLGKTGGRIVPRIYEGYKRRRREKQRQKGRSIFLELKRLRLACAAIVSPQAMRERRFQSETQKARECRRHGFESSKDEQLSAAGSRL